jgi:hypothetical protein
MHARRRDELEARIATLESEYEELIEKTIHDEEVSNVDVGESMAELKVGISVRCQRPMNLTYYGRTNLRLSTLLSGMRT